MKAAKPRIDEIRPAKALLIATAIFLIPVLILIFFMVFGDLIQAYPSQEQHEGVVEVRYFGPEFPEDLRAESGDFDGDGHEDELRVEAYHREPWLGRITSGLVVVRSGQTGDILVAHATASPFSPAYWGPDLNDNGTSEVLIHDEGRAFALGRQGSASRMACVETDASPLDTLHD